MRHSAGLIIVLRCLCAKICAQATMLLLSKHRHEPLVAACWCALPLTPNAAECHPVIAPEARHVDVALCAICMGTVLKLLFSIQLHWIACGVTRPRHLHT